jgi:hypothetical protein
MAATSAEDAALLVVETGDLGEYDGKARATLELQMLFHCRGVLLLLWSDPR